MDKCAMLFSTDTSLLGLGYNAVTGALTPPVTWLVRSILNLAFGRWFVEGRTPCVGVWLCLLDKRHACENGKRSTTDRRGAN